MDINLYKLDQSGRACLTLHGDSDKSIVFNILKSIELEIEIEICQFSKREQILISFCTFMLRFPVKQSL